MTALELKVRTLLCRARPLLVRLGDFIGNDPERNALCLEIAQLDAAQPDAPQRHQNARERLKYGRQDACSRCSHDIEWHGRAVGWIDRGGGRECLPFEHRGHLITPRKGLKHTRAQTWRGSRW